MQGSSAQLERLCSHRGASPSLPPPCVLGLQRSKALLAKGRAPWFSCPTRGASSGGAARTKAARASFSRQDEVVPLFIGLEKDVLSTDRTVGYGEALRVGLKALRLLGITGIMVDVYWGLVESKPQVYEWAGYRQLIRLICDMGFKVKVTLNFNSSHIVPLPAWVLEMGKDNPDIFYADRAGVRSYECLSLGVDDVPALGGRTAVQVYRDLMQSFRDEFGSWLGNNITEVLIGMGPNAELKYPAHPVLDKRWEYPGTGEFQCYDRYMLASLKACAEQVRQSSWGLGGPHDAGRYKEWPHQSGFFHANGNWASVYGRFFLQWYSEMLVRHANQVLCAAADVFEGSPVRLNMRLPGCYWWYNTASHAAELVAGYYHTAHRDGYLPIARVAAHYGVGLHLMSAETRSSERPATHCADPEKLLLAQRTAAAAVGVRCVAENGEVRFDDGALARLEGTLLDPAASQGIEVPPMAALSFSRMCDAMFEPSNWQRFKGFVRRVRERADAAVVAAAQANSPSQASIDYLGDLAEAGSKDCGGNGGPAGGGGSGGSGPKKGGNKVFA